MVLKVLIVVAVIFIVEVEVENVVLIEFRARK
jgi:hypothetical protein